MLLVGHGTRDPAGTDEFFALGERLSEVFGDAAVVAPCLLEFQQPTIAQAWATLMTRKCDRVVVAPLLLFAAGHAKSDIPEEVASARQALGSSDAVDVRFCPPISREPSIVAAVRQRILAAANLGDANRSTAIVMVGRGSRDVCASSDMRLLSEVAVMGRDGDGAIADRLGIDRDGLFTTFYAMAAPRLPDTLAQVAASGRFGRIIVHPHLLFSGRLYEAIRGQMNEAAAEHPTIEFRLSDYLGPTREVAEAVASRIRNVMPIDV